MVLPFDSLDHPLVIAHRGSMVLGPENTIYTFQLAVEAGADVLEMDVHPSSDGEVMVMHDETVDRTSNGSGLVREMTRTQLERLDCAWNFSLDGEDRPLRGQHIGVPTLEEVFERYPALHFSVDVKEDDPKLAADVVALIMKHDLRDRVILGSFHPRVAALLRAVMPPLHLAADRAQGLRLLFGSYLPLPRPGVLPSAYMLPDRLGPLSVGSRALIRTGHRWGRRLYFWTVDSEPAMRGLLERGADGIVTNRPDLLYALRRETARPS